MQTQDQPTVNVITARGDRYRQVKLLGQVDAASIADDAEWEMGHLQLSGPRD